MYFLCASRLGLRLLQHGSVNSSLLELVEMDVTSRLSALYSPGM